MSSAALSDKSARTRLLNDNLRTTFAGGKVVMTAAVSALPDDVKAQVLSKVRSFNEFSTDNDAHGEHDFGSFEINGDRFFWKIDYYAPDMDGGSEDPADPKKTTRVLTIMFAPERSLLKASKNGTCDCGRRSVVAA